MGSAPRDCALVLAFWLIAAQSLPAQFPSPEIASVFPPGGRAGTDLEVELSGTDLDDLTALTFTHPGISGRPLTLPADEVWPEPRPDGLKFAVRIDKGVPPGLYEVRSIGRFGLSTPRLFTVGPATAAAELTIVGGNESPETAASLQLDQVVNGLPTANRADYFKLTLDRGQRVLVHLWGERLDSRIDATLAILDRSGRELAGSRDHIGLDPLADFTAPEKGDYLIKVFDFLYAAGPAHYYRLVATSAPYLDGVFPPAGKAGTTQRFTVYGRNLPGGRPVEIPSGQSSPLEMKTVELRIPDTGELPAIFGGKAWEHLTEGFPWSERGSNPIRVGIAREDVILEDPGTQEQRLSLPVEVAGRFDAPGDLDRYRFSARQGETYVIEVIASRMAVTADPVVTLHQIVAPAPDATDRTETAKFIAESDDTVLDSLAPVGGFALRSSDPVLRFTAPADGDYRVAVSNRFSQSGPLVSYRLGIRPPRPGFTLIAVADKNWQEGLNAMPGVARVHAGGSTSIRVLAMRHDGFDGPIALTVPSQLPPGVFVPPVSIWEQNDEGYLVIRAASHAQDWTGDVSVTGTAEIAGKKVTVPALAGTVAWSAADSSKERVRSRLTHHLSLQVSGEPAPLAVQPAEIKVWEVPLRTSFDVPVQLTRGANLQGAVTVTPWGLPNFKRPASVALGTGATGTAKITLNVDGNNQPFPSEGTFVLKADGLLGKYQTNPEALARWSRWQKSIDATVSRLNAAKNKAASDLSAANSALTSARNAVSALASARPALVKAVGETQARHDAAKRDLETADAALRAVPDAWRSAAQSSHQAMTAAKAGLEKAAGDAQAKAEATRKSVSDAQTALAAASSTHATNRARLEEAVAAARKALSTAQSTLAAAEKSRADHLAARRPLADAAAAAEARLTLAKREAALAVSAVTRETSNHTARVKSLAEAKTKADAALKSPESALASAANALSSRETARSALVKSADDAQAKVAAAKQSSPGTPAVATAEAALASATKAVAAADAALVPLRKARDEAQAKVDAARQAAVAAAAALPTEETAHAGRLASLKTAQEAAAQAVTPLQTGFDAAAKRLAAHDAAKAALEAALAPAARQIETARAALMEAEAKIPAADAAQAPVLAKLTSAVQAASQTQVQAEAAATSAASLLSDHLSASAALAQAIAQSAPPAPASPSPAPSAVPPAKISEWTGTRSRAAAALATASSALTKAKEALAVNEATTPILEAAVKEADARVQAAKTEGDRIAALLAKATAGKTLADAEVRRAQDRSRPRDLKFTVFSEPIPLRILDPTAPR